MLQCYGLLRKDEEDYYEEEFLLWGSKNLETLKTIEASLVSAIVSNSGAGFKYPESSTDWFWIETYAILHFQVEICRYTRDHSSVSVEVQSFSRIPHPCASEVLPLPAGTEDRPPSPWPTRENNILRFSETNPALRCHNVPRTCGLGEALKLLKSWRGKFRLRWVTPNEVRADQRSSGKDAPLLSIWRQRSRCLLLEFVEASVAEEVHRNLTGRTPKTHLSDAFLEEV